MMGFNGSWERDSKGNKTLLHDICDSKFNINDSRWKNPEGNSIEQANKPQEMNISLQERLKSAGANEGKLNFSLEWFDGNDLDLHLMCPCGTHIYFRNRKCNSCLAELDVDMNAGGEKDEIHPVEHIKINSMKEGKYNITVNYFGRKSGATSSNFNVKVHADNKELASWVGLQVSESEINRVLDYSYSLGITFPEHRKKNFENWSINAKSTELVDKFHDSCLKKLTELHKELEENYFAH